MSFLGSGMAGIGIGLGRLDVAAGREGVRERRIARFVSNEIGVEVDDGDFHRVLGDGGGEGARGLVGSADVGGGRCGGDRDALGGAAICA